MMDIRLHGHNCDHVTDTNAKTEHIVSLTGQKLREIGAEQ